MCTHADESQHNNLPCLHCQPHSYIRMVHNYIYTHTVYSLYVLYLM